MGFVHCKKVVLDDSILPRKVWVECLGLPVSAWALDTFKDLSKYWGDLISESDMLNEDSNF